MIDFNLKLINTQPELRSLSQRLESTSALALDIETVNWWNRRLERVALIQIAYRENRQLKVAVIDALSGLDYQALQRPLESSTTSKAIHNAAYDAVRLAHHFQINTSPIHDTMRAARKCGEKRYSLQAQAATHLGFHLDKSEQRGDWSQRPLTIKQLRYAALDAACTLLLYENQIARGLVGSYQLRSTSERLQGSLPLSDALISPPVSQENPKVTEDEARDTEELSAIASALLGVVVEMSGRYSPERLAASAGSERVGLAGWIIDQRLGSETDIDEETAKLELAELCESGLIRLSMARRLEATEAGMNLWQQIRPTSEVK
jgi:DNA polymerase III epsilon subunit-like protein